MMIANENFTTFIAVNYIGQSFPTESGLDLLLSEREEKDE